VIRAGCCSANIKVQFLAILVDCLKNFSHRCC